MFGLLTRLQAFNEGATREIAADNPFASASCIRSLAEVVALICYLIEKPQELRRVSIHASDQDRFNIGKLLMAAHREASGFKAVYEQLSNFAHPSYAGSTVSMKLMDDNHFTWTSAPSFKYDSEVLVEQAITARPGARRVLDCGTGSGALLLAVLHELPEATGVGIDRSPAALAVARANAGALVGSRATMIERDWSQPGWAGDLGRFDLVLANPPYVENDAALEPDVRDFEPAGALFAGAEGLDAYRLLVPQLPGLLAPGGLALVEIGHRQDAAVTAIAASAGMAARLHHDLAGRPRALELWIN